MLLKRKSRSAESNYRRIEKRMNVTDCFTFATHDGMCDVITISQLPTDRLRLMLDFAFKAYSPIVLVAESIGSTEYAYKLGWVAGNLDPLRFLEVVGRFEEGWQLKDEIIYSPRPSQIKSRIITEAINLARLAAVK
jgi:hypothetical protein